MREYALLQRVFMELEDRLGMGYAPASLLVADLPGSQAAAVLAAHDKWGGSEGSLVTIASPNTVAIAAFRELRPDEGVKLSHVGGADGSSDRSRRYDLICATFDGHNGSGLAQAMSLRGASTAASALAMSDLLNPGGVLLLLEPLGALHIGRDELNLEPSFVPAVQRLAVEQIAAGAPLRTIAPCMHSLACPMQADPRAFHAKHTRHCIFGQRYERRRTQRLGGLRQDLSFANTHFAYLCLARGQEGEPSPVTAETQAERLPGAKADMAAVSARIMAPPRKRGGHVMLDICTERAELRTVTITQKKHGDGAEEEVDEDKEDSLRSPYRTARKSTWGDPWSGDGI
ncbi:mitochondrial small ribosomal subunit Rsm22-domain-containing protein [Pavlovales sp. CCMP2436]|nr:mitochondrial small ribosomal subunit Rsm22-domain-containing protein [Pavlovales sp. CCMP2436]